MPTPYHNKAGIVFFDARGEFVKDRAQASGKAKCTVLAWCIRSLRHKFLREESCYHEEKAGPSLRSG
jgi:hypothetical protein